nr:TSUP family transporter [Agrobacterium tumefaciens]
MRGGLFGERRSPLPPPARTSSVQDIALNVFIVLFCVAIFAGFIDSIAGGGGLITIPAMLIMGIAPLDTLGTNKLQSQFGSASATLAYARRGHVDLKEQLPMGLMAMLGGMLGAVTAAFVPADLLRTIMPFLLIAIALYFAFKPQLSDIDSHRRITPFVFGLTVAPLVGFYDGVFGPGAGSFYMLAFVALAGFGMLKATAHTKLLNLGSNFGGFVVFAIGGAVLWKLGLAMGVGQFIGAQIGSRFAMKNGAKIIRPLLVLSCLAMATKLLVDASSAWSIATIWETIFPK